MSTDAYEKIWQKVAEIPSGKVATYGQVAALVNLPRHARLVGYALRKAPKSMALSWHRVVNAKGELSFPINSEGYNTQKKRLLDEGIEFVGKRINLASFQWQVSLDELLWKP